MENSLAQKKVLIVDDSMQFAEHMRRILSEAGYETVCAHCGEDALELVEAEKPDIVLLDVVMPGINGFDVCRVLRNSESNDLMPIIMLTAKADHEDQVSGLELGADDYVIKPFDERELLSRVKNTLRRVNRVRNVNPLTGLPGSLEIQREVGDRIKQEKTFAIAFIDLNLLRAYNEVYGFAKGDMVIKAVAGMITKLVTECGNKGDFVGHAGGDNFVVISSPSRIEIICNNLISTFDGAIKDYYDDDDLENGFIYTVNRRGEMIQYPILSLSIAVATNEFIKFDSYHKFSDVGKELMGQLAGMGGSNYFRDRRKE